MAPATDAPDDAEAEQLERGSSAERRIGALVAGNYRLTRHIGSGGSSHVFEAEHVRLGKRFAVKLLRPELDPNRRTAQRFRREARAIARLKSEHIVSVIDCGELDDRTPYLVMELLEGEDLRSLLNREGSLPPRRAVPLIIEACRGLSEVHAAGLVHRDLKPENLFITRRSTSEDWCKVLDFGVAKMDASLSTAQGAIVGTLRYMAPEQLEASRSVGPATDVHALGAILYECLCGQPAHHGDTPQEVMYSVMNRLSPDAPLHAAKVPTVLISAIMACLAKEPEQRPQSMAELKDSIALPSGVAGKSISDQTVSEDDTGVGANRSRSAGVLSNGLFWAVAAGALILLWLARVALPTSSRPPRTRPDLGSASTEALSLASASKAGRVVPAIETSPNDADATPGGAAQPAASAKNHARPGREPSNARGVTNLPPRSTRALVGGFDVANPYSE